MNFLETHLPGVFIVELDKIGDERGFFARAWCRREFQAHGLDGSIAQLNLSHNARRGTVRGMHYQVQPHAEAKVVRCIRGAIYDVVVDLRTDSVTYRKWLAVELSAGNRRMLHVPEGCGHGFQTLEDGTELLYQVTEFFAPGAERGVRYDDPAFQIDWPLPVTAISDKDASWPDFVPEPQ